MIKKINLQQEALNYFTSSANDILPLYKNKSIDNPDQQFFQKVWKNLKTVLNLVYKKGIEIENEYEISYQELSEDIRLIGIYNLDEGLFEELIQYYKIFITKEIDFLSPEPKEDLLIKLDELWSILSQNMNLISDIIIWLERGYMSHSRLDTRTIEMLILKILKENLELNNEFKYKIINQLLIMIKKSRDDHQYTDQSFLLKSVIMLLIKTDLYENDFEPKLLEQTEVYYQAECEKMILKFDIVEYLKNTVNRLTEETNRASEYLYISTKDKLISKLERIFINDQLQLILTNGFDILMNGKHLDQLKQLYNLLQNVSKIDFLKKTWGYYIKTKGTALINEEKVTMDELLEYKSMLYHVANECFSKNYILMTTLHYTFEDVINLRINKVTELTSRYIDHNLRNAHKLHLNEQDLQKKLIESIDIFKFILAKDIFEAFYTKRLIKRLLLRTISSNELEFWMIGKLKEVCGMEYTKKSEDLFKEYEISKGLNAEFLESQYAKDLQYRLDIHVNIFSANTWPLKNEAIKKFITPLEEYAQAYTLFYTNKYTGVVLYWQYETSTCELLGNFSNDLKIILVVSIIQAFILLLFNTHKSITYHELQQIIGIDSQKLKGELLVLITEKEKIILKDTNDKKIQDDTVLTLNTAYTSKAKRVKINSFQKRESIEDIEQTTIRVLQEREHLLDAAIVRIMKAKKTLAHKDLINEIFNELKLPIPIADIKKRIESLIERDYISRDPNNIQVYNYIA